MLRVKAHDQKIISRGDENVHSRWGMLSSTLNISLNVAARLQSLRIKLTMMQSDRWREQTWREADGKRWWWKNLGRRRGRQEIIKEHTGKLVSTDTESKGRFSMMYWKKKNYYWCMRQAAGRIFRISRCMHIDGYALRILGNWPPNDQRSAGWSERLNKKSDWNLTPNGNTYASTCKPFESYLVKRSACGDAYRKGMLEKTTSRAVIH